MPAFGIKHGGMLTEAQIDALVTGMRAHWSKGNVLAGQNAPPYKAAHEGDSAKGEAVYTTACAKCHEPQPDKGGYAGSILDGSFLALINEQTIRTTVIAGRPDLGMPDWRGLVKGRSLTDEEITDVTAWLMAQKPALPGQPYASPAQKIPAQTQTTTPPQRRQGSEESMSDQSLSTGTEAAASDLSRRTFLMKVGIALNAVVAAAIATPVVAYVLGPVIKRKDYLEWVALGGVEDFPVGETTLVTFHNPFSNSWDGATANVPAYVKRTGANDFTVFAINCAHLGCPVRWFKESQLFMCPCHGGVYYADGSRASGPPERGLFTTT